MLTRRLPDEKGLGERHEVEYNLDLIRALGLPVSVPEVVLSLVASEDATVLQLLEAHGITRDRHFVVIHPWASHARKEWPLERAQALAGQITQRLGWGVAIIGGAESRGRLDAARWDAGRIVDLVGRLSLTQLAALLARARVAVSTDSGPMHLAAAVGTPTVALFGTSDPATGPRRWGPWGAGHTVIWKPSMEAIGVPDVLRALEQQRSMRRLDVSA
jgi:ADP-heptose:LPS heptosyltransferase